MNAFELQTDAIDPVTYRFERRYTCDSDNSSPELRWTEPPGGTQSLAFIMEDPDAPGGTFIHWIVYAIPPTIRHLPAGIPPQELLPNGIKQGLNTAKKLGYFGPCPPVGSSPHRYQLTLYALKHPLPEDLQRLPAAILRERIRQAAFEQTSLQGRYDRPAKKAG